MRLKQRKETEIVPPETVIYFAYGSNMATARLRKRIPSCKPLSIATLPDHTLRFHKRGKDGSGKCNAFAGGGGNSVIGVLFSFDLAEQVDLDRAEGVGRGYERAEVTVIKDQNCTQKAMTYLATADYIDGKLQPYGWYKNFVLAGGWEHGLPPEYIAEYIQAIEAIVDPNKKRDVEQRATLAGFGR